MDSLGSIAEGVPTTKAAYQLARQLNVESPITDAVYHVLYEGKAVEEVVKELMCREIGGELDGIQMSFLGYLNTLRK